MVEYSKDNRFPFHTKDKSVAIYTDDNEGLHELDFIFSKIVERFPSLEPSAFYVEVGNIQGMRERVGVKKLKMLTDNLMKNIKLCLMDEEFVH